MEHKVTFHIPLVKSREAPDLPKGTFIEQTFTQVTDTEAEAEEFGEETAKITLAFLNGYGAGSD